MILLLGGTSETADIAAALAAAGLQVLVSTATATESPLDLPRHPLIERRRGRLNAEALLALLVEIRARAVVDATHPYAVEAHRNAQAAARAAGLAYLRYERPATPGSELEGALRAASHDDAARIAFSFQCPVLLTVGSRNLTPYAQMARQTGLPLFARVLPVDESLQACRLAGLGPDSILAARGPFSIELNRRTIRATQAGVLVTKESGLEGGVPAKIEAARLEGCRVVLVSRPGEASSCPVYSLDHLLVALGSKPG